ncbi:MAG: hypothetical protein KDI17_16905 [Halioglobus sp.]|nr:hypothetical protein [Halioglobus sp.]
MFWLVLMLLAIGNGFLREVTYGQFLSELHSHQLSTVLAMALFGVSVFLLSKYSLPDSATQAVAIGLVWLASTLCFEFLFGRYVAGHSWGRLFQDYNVLSGRVWVLLLAWVTCLPYIAYKYFERTT